MSRVHFTKWQPNSFRKEAIYLVDTMDQKDPWMKKASEVQDPLEEKHVDAAIHLSQEQKRMMQKRKKYFALLQKMDLFKVNPGISTALTQNILLEKLWKKKRSIWISEALRYKTETFSFLGLQRRGKNLDAAFSSQEENILLLAYEKNLVRMLYFLCQNFLFSWQMKKYYSFFIEKLDIYTRNLYFNKLKQWMNSDIFKASYKYNEIEKYLWKPDDLNAPPEDPESHSPRPSLFHKSLEFLQNQFAVRWKTQGDREKVKMSNIASYYPLSHVFQRITQSYSFLIACLLNQKDFTQPFVGKSKYLRSFMKEILCDILAQLKMLNVTEPWILHTVKIYQSTIQQIHSFVSSITNISYKPSLFGKRKQTPFFPSFLKGQEKKTLFVLPKSIQEAFHRIKQMVELTTMHHILFDTKNSNVLEKEIPRSTPSILRKTTPLLQAYRRQKKCYMSFYEKILEQQKTDVTSMEYMYRISKNVKYTIAQDHLRLVMSVAKSAKYRTIDMSDLLQEGMLGLTKAVERFQLDRGYQFTTYATWWVHQALNRVTLSSNPILPLPTHLQRKIHLILSTSNELAKRFRREPFVEEIAAELRLPVQKIYQLIQTSSMSRRFVSLDQTFRAGGSYLNFLQTPTHNVPMDGSPFFLSFFTFLSPKEATIFKMRFGFYPFKRHTIEQVAKIFSVSRERIKVLEKHCFEKIRTALIPIPHSSALFQAFIQSFHTSL